jgi:hypothetical protein
MTRTMKLLKSSCCALLLALRLVPSQAFAQLDPKREALQHYDRALSWMRGNAYLKAIPELERAYELGHDYIVLYDLGQAYLAVNQPVYAIDALAKYLREGQARLSTAQRSKIEAEIARQQLRVATLTVMADVKGAVVRFDGVEVSRTPMPNELRVNAGTHRLTVEAIGYRPWDHPVDLAGQERRVVEIKLEQEMPLVTEAVPGPTAPPGPALTPTAPPNPTVATPSGSASPEPAPTLGASSSDASPGPAGTRKTVAYIVGGLGIGALAVGSVFGVRAITKQNDSNDQCPNGRCSQEAVRLNDQAKTAAWVSDFTIGAGLVAVGVAAYLLIRSPAPAASPSHAMRVVPEVGPGQAGLALGGSW